jgi:hypothetical protein
MGIVEIAFTIRVYRFKRQEPRIAQAYFFSVEDD